MESIPSDPKKSRPSNKFLKYSNLTLQLFVAMGVAAWLGHWLDQRLGLQFPAFLLLFLLLSFGAMMYQIYQSLNKD